MRNVIVGSPTLLKYCTSNLPYLSVILVDFSFFKIRITESFQPKHGIRVQEEYGYVLLSLWREVEKKNNAINFPAKRYWSGGKNSCAYSRYVLHSYKVLLCNNHGFYIFILVSSVNTIKWKLGTRSTDADYVRTELLYPSNQLV